MPRLYEISNDLRALLDANDEGELTPEALEQFEALSLAMDTKVDVICGLVAEWKSIVAVRQAEIDRLRAGIATRENGIKRLKEYLREALLAVDAKNHETALWTIWRQNSPPAVQCQVDPSTLPAEWQKVTVTPDNAKALDRWKTTGEAPAGFDVTVNEHVRIK